MSYWLTLLGVLAAAYFGCVLLGSFAANRMMFYPEMASRAEPANAVTLRLADGTKVSAVYLPTRGARFTLWHFHGNAEALGDIAGRLENFRKLGGAVFAVEYPGYGTADGKPSESSVYAACAAGVDYLTTVLKIPMEQVVIHGRSIGGGPAVHVAAKKRVAGLILESAFTSAYRVMLRWPLLLGDKFRNEAQIANVHCPVLIVHGREDRIVPFHHGETLYAAARERKQRLWVDGAGHNDVELIAGERYVAALVDFTREL